MTPARNHFPNSILNYFQDMETTGFLGGPIKKERGRPRKYGNDGGALVLNPYPISSVAPSTSHVIEFSASETTVETTGFLGGPIKKERGRPRKYRNDGGALVLSPYPISSVAPTTSHVIDFSASEKRVNEKSATIYPKKKKSVTTPISFITSKYEVENSGEWAPSSAGSIFTPHIITVKAGEDVTQKIILFSQQKSEAICVLCANGVLSSVTLRQPDSFGGTLTYEGRFGILSLSGSFMPSDSDGTRRTTGGMTVSVASTDGPILGGAVAGLLVAATPIQVVVGSFLAGVNQQDQRPKQQNQNFMASPVPTIHPTPSSLPSSSWTPSLGFDHRHQPAHDLNITLT